MKKINKIVGFIAVTVVAVAMIGFTKNAAESGIFAIIGFLIVAVMD